MSIEFFANTIETGLDDWLKDGRARLIDRQNRPESNINSERFSIARMRIRRFPGSVSIMYISAAFLAASEIAGSRMLSAAMPQTDIMISI